MVYRQAFLSRCVRVWGAPFGNAKSGFARGRAVGAPERLAWLRIGVICMCRCSFACLLRHQFRPAGRVTFSSRAMPGREKVTKNACPRHPAPPAAGFPHSIIAPGARPDAANRRWAIPGPSRLSRHPCRSTLSTTIPLTLLKGRLAPPESPVSGSHAPRGNPSRNAPFRAISNQIPQLAQSANSCIPTQSVGTITARSAK